MTGRAARLAALVLALALAPPGPPARAGLVEDRAGLAQLQEEDLRLQAIGWKLAVGNARFCDAAPAIGLLLQDMASYAAPERMRAAAGIAGDVAVQAVVPGAPAAAAGLSPNDEVIAIDGEPMAALPQAKAGSWQRLAALNDRLEAALARDGAVRIAWRKADGSTGDAAIAGVPACRSRFELVDGGGKAIADGQRVLIGRGFAGTGYDEELFAAAIAHELAHNLLRHRGWLKQVGRKRSNIRVTEREADRLMPWLLANAGYDPQAAARFFHRWGPRNGGWIFRARTHDGWDERAGFVRGELPQVEALMTREGAADWRTHFRRDTGD
ncbi:PDZ domain-containing protein [Tsuneonella sp. YG55]|uniref:PDZ domain-containing protein n=1 Tax=Tsuneonella litorea TaxID=2976475 RepID=A0A9X3AM65_9SPHN|nr:PDZ domain-containing protein [Tsuneonella litorea]MCT2557942.1 PDZ domain-containing protein [Tsuneonella litorea]